jgi:hypothetical protein
MQKYPSEDILRMRCNYSEDEETAELVGEKKMTL